MEIKPSHRGNIVSVDASAQTSALARAVSPATVSSREKIPPDTKIRILRAIALRRVVLAIKLAWGKGAVKKKEAIARNPGKGLPAYLPEAYAGYALARCKPD